MNSSEKRREEAVRMVHAKQAFESACCAEADQEILNTLYDLMIQRAREYNQREQEQEEE